MVAFRPLRSVLGKTYERLFFSGTPVYIFHHIPKSGGTSVREALAKWFKTISDYRPSVEKTPATLKFLNNRLKIDRYNSRYCISGHFELPGNYLHERYPEIIEQPERYRIFTVFRDPLNLAVSLYYYQLQEKIRKKEDETLEDFVKKINNYTAGRLPCNMDDYLEILNRYFFIGINEYMQESLDKLAVLLKKPKIKVPELNRSPKDKQALNISSDTVQVFRKNNALDYLIYQHALKNFKEM